MKALFEVQIEGSEVYLIIEVGGIERSRCVLNAREAMELGQMLIDGGTGVEYYGPDGVKRSMLRR